MDLSILKKFHTKPALNIHVEGHVLDDLNVVSALYARGVEPLEDSPGKMSMDESEELWTI